ncbi:Binding-protein-dependent transport systems inner membrane component [Frankia canadensis]|uniref:Binding-protein-dependent transport systems inner membrane component n=1 Tax=Frankia canadensis TaxID=1836972 RepID=A0A2I2L0Q1_9ACTN|nr:carbohydrate ABC transporter permease [Frankia canadensis]SNQ51488.1 Binding-protein-dependent transport systems inner membrane component [Frankia canadensis]SOU58778.1 Binding-protein-dependent transport systems inner membrane component [Frankia canadensis]
MTSPDAVSPVGVSLGGATIPRQSGVLAPTAPAGTSPARPRRAASRRARRIAGAVGRHTLLLAAVAVMVLPVLWALAASFKTPGGIFDENPLPMSPTLENYRVATGAFPVWRLLLNTAAMAAGVTLLQLLIAVPAAYALVRFPPRAHRVLTALIVITLLVPPQSLIIPLFLMISHLGWRNTYPGLVLPQLYGTGLAVILLRDHVRAVPPTVLGAAVLDGARPGEVLRLVLLPLLRPALGAVSILLFITSWNEYLWPSLAAPDIDHASIQPGLAFFLTQEGPEYGPLLAGSMLATLPIVAVYLVASRRVTDAFMHSGIR